MNFVPPEYKFSKKWRIINVVIAIIIFAALCTILLPQALEQITNAERFPQDHHQYPSFGIFDILLWVVLIAFIIGIIISPQEGVKPK